MKNRKTLTLIMVLSFILVSYNSFAQTAEELLPKAIQLEEVKGDIDNAIKTYQVILNKFPDDREVCAEAMLHLGMCYEKLGLDQARQTYRDVISKYSEQADKVAMARNRISRLDAYTAELIAKAQQYLEKGNELFKLWEYESAIKEYENAIESGPNTQLALNAQYCIGQSWFRAGKYETALASFTKLIVENPKSNIAPVTELMVAQVKHAMETDKRKGMINNFPDENTIIDPETGITYRKIKTFTGKNDIIEWTPSTSLSPNGKFLLYGNTIVPMDGSDPINFVDMEAVRSTWSPDGENIAFTCGDSSIYIVPVSLESGHTIGTPKELLTREKGCSLYYLNWSPDSKKLFFHLVDYPKKEYPQIFSLSISDGVVKSLTTEAIPQVNPSCSPDGNTIAFKGPFRDLWVCPVNGGAGNKLVDDGHTRPNWTLDGKWLFSDATVYGGARSLNFIRLEDRFEFNFTPPAKTGSYLSLSPTGDRIMFYRSSYSLIWGMKVASTSGGPSYEPVSSLPVYGAQWSKNSKMIFVDGEKQNKMEEGDNAMRIVPITGGESFLFDMDVDVQGMPFAYYITPDQKRILFVTKKDGDETDDLYMAPISIEEARIIGPPTRIIENWNRGGAHNTKMSMSHDGTKLAIVNNEDIWIYDMDRKVLKQITETSETKKWVAWSPDDKMISYWAFNDNPDFKVETRIISSDGIQTIKTLENCMIYPIHWSPDSKSVTNLEDGKIFIRNIFSDEKSVILDANTYGFDDIGNYIWSPDGKFLVIDGIKNVKSEKKYHLSKISVNNGKLTELASDDLSFKYDIFVSPDGKWICYCYEEMEKVRPESPLWEADYDEIMKKLAK